MKAEQSDVLHRGETIVSLEVLPEYSRPVVTKRPAERHPSARILGALETEYEMAQVLDGVEGVRRVLGRQTIADRPALILEFVAGTTLAKHLAGCVLELRSRLEFAVDLARLVDAIHRRNILHLDLSSENILVRDEDLAVCLIDLGTAVRSEGTGHQKARPGRLVGSLSYMAPEQTGRINRSVDERSDLYSLGVILYELMTGSLPFVADSPLELVHHHIARAPVPPSAVAPGIPEVVDAIILKLLAKDAEDRYQSAAGVEFDLRECLQRLRPRGTIEDFALGTGDRRRRLTIPQRLYGRERELKELEQAFDTACRENAVTMFVCGYSGIGKTALVEELRRTVAEGHGHFVMGKFDQYLRTTPHAAITQALNAFVAQVLAEPEQRFAAWRDRIQTAVGDLGGVLTGVVPDLDKIIGAQPAVPQLGGQEAENRFHFVFVRFLETVASEESPLVLFIDDLQWIDSASLRLLQVIRSDCDRPGLMVIGAYRDNEVGASHPLMAIVGDDREGPRPRILKLDDLQPEHLEALLVDTLGLHDGVSELGMAIYEKTRGNPFFFRSLLTSLNQDSTIRFDAETEAWAWDIIGIRSESVADNVAELLAANIGQLPAETRDVLALAACIGNRFDLSTLAMIAGLEEQEVVARLHVSSIGSYVVESGGTCEFGHDQVQQAALELIDRPQRMRRHLELARLLVTATGEEDLDERIFEIVAHYGLCTDLLTDAAEKLRVAELDLRAARKAKLSSAYGTAIDYLEHGLGLQGENGWEEHYRLTLALHDELIETYNLDIRYQDVATLFATIRDHARIPVDARVAYQTMILMKIGQAELTEAITLAEAYLGELRISLDEEFETVLSAAELAALPVMEDPEMLAALEIMMVITTPLVFTAPERLPSLFRTMLNIIGRHGNSDVSCFAVTWYATTLCMMGRYDEGNLYGRLGVDLLHRFKSRGMASKVMNMQCAWIRHWQTTVHDLIDPLEEYGRVGLRDGDFEWALYCLGNRAILQWGTGTPLAVFAEDAAEYIGLCEGKQQEVTLFICSLFAESARNLAGESPHTTQLEGPWFSERNTLPRLEGNVFVLTFYSLVKTTLCFLFGAEEEARRHAADALVTRGSISPHYLYTKISFYGGLAGLTGLAAGGEEADRGERLEQVDLCVQDLASWAASAPMNYGHKHKLLRAERARVANDPWQAVRSYEEAIAEARENRFVHEEALANELCGRFWLGQDNDKVARVYLHEARRLYERWGARAKVYHLEQSHPQLFLVGVAKDKQADVAAPVDPAQFDLDGIVGASQALSSETDLVRLVTRLMELMMTCSGASDVVLLLRRGEDWFVRAHGDVAADERVLLIDLPYPPSAGDTDRGYVPAPVFDYCRRSHHTLVVGDVRQDRRFDASGDVRSRDARSLACLPVLHQGNLRAMLYLEHRLMTEVFTPDRMEILGHLSAQLGVSLENALLYEDLARKLEELRTSEERYALAVSGSAAGLWDWDLETDKVFYSDRLQELLGHEPGDFSDSLDEFWSRLHPEEEAAVRSTFDHHLEDRDPFSIDCRLRAADGGFRWFHARGQASWSADGAAVRMSGSITDITERKQAEEDLARSEHHFRSLMEQSPLAVEILAPDGRITQVNSAWRRLWGVDETDAKRVLANYNMLEDEQIRERGFEQQVAAAFAGEAVILPPFQYDATRCANEIDLDDLEASAPWIQCHLSPVKDADGEILFVVNTYVDLTELKRAEEEARKHQEALARVDRASSLGQLTGSIAHELNQPLTGILSNAQAAEMVLETGLENRDELAEIMADIVADTKRAGAVIRNLRDLYREQVGDLKIVDLNVIVEETVRLLRSEIVVRHVSLTTERDPRVLEVLGNKVQLQQVVVNLVMNAIQAMQDSDREVRRIRITAAHRGRKAEIRVEDRGPGIDPDKIAHIFDPLATWKSGGTGIGLAISNAIIRAHGGRMWAKNRRGGGACVGYTLPLLKEGERR